MTHEFPKPGKTESQNTFGPDQFISNGVIHRHPGTVKLNNNLGDKIESNEKINPYPEKIPLIFHPSSRSQEIIPSEFRLNLENNRLFEKGNSDYFDLTLRSKIHI